MKYGKSLLLLGTLLLTLNVQPQAAFSQGAALAPTPPPQSASPLEALNLTPEQQRQVDNIQQLLNAKMKTALSPEQFAQLRAIQAAGQTPSPSQLQLSKKQRKQIKEAQDFAEYQLSLLLTPAQKQQLGEILRSQR